MKRYDKIKCVLTFIIAFLIVVLALSSVLIHAHVCYDQECMVCAIVNIYKNNLCVTVVLGAIFFALIQAFINYEKNSYLLSNINTLVGLKVKLLN